MQNFQHLECDGGSGVGSQRQKVLSCEADGELRHEPSLGSKHDSPEHLGHLPLLHPLRCYLSSQSELCPYLTSFGR